MQFQIFIDLFKLAGMGLDLFGVMGNTEANLSDHFPARLVALPVAGFLAELLYNALTRRPILQCEFRQDFAKRSRFRIANLLWRHTQPQEEFAESKHHHEMIEITEGWNLSLQTS